MLVLSGTWLSLVSLLLRSIDIDHLSLILGRRAMILFLSFKQFISLYRQNLPIRIDRQQLKKLMRNKY